MIEFTVDENVHHAAELRYMARSISKMLDDAAFYAANSLVNDRFPLTTGLT